MQKTMSRAESDAFVARIEKEFDDCGFGFWAVEVPNHVAVHRLCRIAPRGVRRSLHARGRSRMATRPEALGPWIRNRGGSQCGSLRTRRGRSCRDHLLHQPGQRPVMEGDGTPRHDSRSGVGLRARERSSGTLASSPYLLQISACRPVAVAPDLPLGTRCAVASWARSSPGRERLRVTRTCSGRARG